MPSRWRHTQTLVRAAFEHKFVERARRVLLPLMLVLSVCFFGYVINRRYPIGDWLFLRYAKSWLLIVYWFSGVMSGGYALVSRLAPRWPLAERLVLSCAAGVYLNYLFTFVGGIFGLYRFGVFAACLPLLLIALGARRLGSVLRRAFRHWQAARLKTPRKFSLPAVVIGAFGTIYLALLYLNILTPDNASFDAVYYHLGIPQQHAALGGIYRTAEAWIVDGLPNMASVIYTWAFVFPSNSLFDSMMGCAHMEYVLFVATLLSLPVLVRWLVPRSRSWGAWTAMFLFPAILVYDAGLHSANDHIAAFWGPPIWVALRRSWQRLEPRAMVLFAIAASGALLTKYQAFNLILAPALALCVRGAVLALKRSGAPWWQGLGTALGVALLVTAPHWLKNWVWYNDPLFPALYRHLPLPDGHHPHAAETIEQTTRLLARPQGSFVEQVSQIFRGAVEFPFRTRERRDFHRDWPIFGPLFHLSFFWLPFLRGSKRIWLLFLATFAGLFFWYYFVHYERYLQPLIPWMAAVTAATLILMWRRGWITKLGVVAMVALEVVWGGDVYFFPHLMLHDSPIRAAANMITTGYKNEIAGRDNFLRPFKQIGDALPPGSRVLLHEYHPRLGLQAPVISDYPGFQTLISYQDLGSPRAIYDQYRELGVTHIIYQNAYSCWLDSLGGDLRFWEFVTHWATNHKRHGPFVMAEMPKAPPDQALSSVAYLSCDPSYTRGLHPVEALHIRPGQPGTVRAQVPLGKGKKEILELVEQAGFLVTSDTCTTLKLPSQVFTDFSKMAKRGAEDLWIRRRPGPHAAPR